MNEHSIYQQAHYKGNAAVQMTTVTPMVVQQRANPLNDDSELIRQYCSQVTVYAGLLALTSNPQIASLLNSWLLTG
jgi:hypothetical protein